MSARSARYTVWARVAWAAVDTAERAGLDTARLYDDLPFDACSIRKLSRVDWADYCQIVERIEALVGGGETFDRFVETQYYESLPEFIELAGALVSPKQLYRLVYEVIDPLTFPALEHHYEDIGEDRVRVGQWLRPGARPCLALFRASVAALRGLTCIMGLPPAEVEFELSPAHYMADVRLPPSRTIAARLQRALRQATRIVLGYSPEGQAISAVIGGDAAPDREIRIADITRTHGLTPRQADVLAGILDGRSNKEIARSLACAESTVEKHMTTLLGKLGMASRAEVISRLLKH